MQFFGIYWWFFLKSGLLGSPLVANVQLIDLRSIIVSFLDVQTYGPRAAILKLSHCEVGHPLVYLRSCRSHHKKTKASGSSQPRLTQLALLLT